LDYVVCVGVDIHNNYAYGKQKLGRLGLVVSIIISYVFFLSAKAKVTKALECVLI